MLQYLIYIVTSTNECIYQQSELQWMQNHSLYISLNSDGIRCQTTKKSVTFQLLYYETSKNTEKKRELFYVWMRCFFLTAMCAYVCIMYMLLRRTMKNKNGVIVMFRNVFLVIFLSYFYSLPLISTFRFDNILPMLSCFVTSILLHFMWTFNVLFTQCYYFLVLCGFLFRFSQMLLFHFLCFWLLLSNFQFIFMHLLYHW